MFRGQRIRCSQIDLSILRHIIIILSLHQIDLAAEMRLVRELRIYV